MNRNTNGTHGVNIRIVAACAGILVLGIVAHAPAALITWGTATQISAPSDVMTTGTLVHAYAFGGDPGATVNGVAFSPTLTQNSVTLSWTSGTGLNGNYPGFETGLISDPGYHTLMTYGTYNNGPGGPVTVTYSGLLVGRTYDLEFWENDDRPGSNPDVLTGTSNVTVLPYVGSGTGQFVIGTFTTDSSSVSFDVQGFIALANAMELRVEPLPEPASVALLGLGGLLAFCSRRGAVARRL